MPHGHSAPSGSSASTSKPAASGSSRISQSSDSEAWSVRRTRRLCPTRGDWSVLVRYCGRPRRSLVRSTCRNSRDTVRRFSAPVGGPGLGTSAFASHDQ